MTIAQIVELPETLLTRMKLIGWAQFDPHEGPELSADLDAYAKAIHDATIQWYKAKLGAADAFLRLEREAWHDGKQVVVKMDAVRREFDTRLRAPTCGFCKDTGVAPWMMGDYLRPCGYCEKGRVIEESGHWIDLDGQPLAANPPRTAVDKMRCECHGVKNCPSAHPPTTKDTP